MRIEESFTVAAPGERVYEGLLSSEVLGRAIPDCERLTQMGPTEADGTVTFEARVQSEGAFWTVAAQLRGGRRRDRVEVALEALGPAGSYEGSGALTLGRVNGKTQVACELSIEGDGVSEERVREVVESLCSGLEAALDGAAESDGHAGAESLEVVEQRSLSGVGRRAAWMVGGLMLGIAGLALVSSLARRFARRGDEEQQ